MAVPILRLDARTLIVALGAEANDEDLLELQTTLAHRVAAMSATR